MRLESLLTRYIMAVWKGGAGVKAPYRTTHVRVPVDIKEKVEKLSQDFKHGIVDSDPLPFDEAVEKARELLKNKKSVKLKMESLLTAIYRRDQTVL